MNDTQQKLDRAEQLIIQVLLNISKSTEILSNNLDEVNSINNSSNNNNNMNNNVNNINQLTLQIINNMNEVGTILKENKKVLFPLEDYTNRKNVKSTYFYVSFSFFLLSHRKLVHIFKIYKNQYMFNKHGKYNVEVDINRNQNGKEECCHVFDAYNPNKTYGIVIILANVNTNTNVTVAISHSISLP